MKSFQIYSSILESVVDHWNHPIHALWKVYEFIQKLKKDKIFFQDTFFLIHSRYFDKQKIFCYSIFNVNLQKASFIICQFWRSFSSKMDKDHSLSVTWDRDSNYKTITKTSFSEILCIISSCQNTALETMSLSWLQCYHVINETTLNFTISRKRVEKKICLEWFIISDYDQEILISEDHIVRMWFRRSTSSESLSKWNHSE